MRSYPWVTMSITVALTLIGASCGTDDSLVDTEGADAGCAPSDIAAIGAVHDETPAHEDDDDTAPAHDDEEDASAHEEEEDTLGVEDAELAFAIDMVEFAYSCELPPIPSGTIVALQFTNSGVVDHEAVVGDQNVQNEAELAMASMAAGSEGHGHAAPSITVKPGETGMLVVHFDEPGDLIIGCHIPGHWDAGMHSAMTVAAA
jgi:hypothetical protein